MTGEPRLEDIDDYNNLKGDKKRIVWIVIIVGIIIGAIYLYINNNFGTVKDQIKTTDIIQKVPVCQQIPLQK